MLEEYFLFWLLLLCVFNGAEGKHLVDFIVTAHCSCSQVGLSGVYMAVKLQRLLSRSNLDKINMSFLFFKEEINIMLG